MMLGSYGMGYLGWSFGALIAVGVVILVVVAIRLAIRHRSPVNSTTPDASTSLVAGSGPKQILDERYARGELTTAEYRERLSALGLGN
jgi:putative membrane protein